MNFNELKQILENELGVVHLSDIARELGVSPQTVNNWKNRDTIPYKYVKKVKSIQAKKINQNYRAGIDKGFLNFFDDGTVEAEVDEPEFHEMVIKILKSVYFSIKNHFRLVISFTILISLITVIYSYYYAPIVFQSQITIIPLSSGSSNTSSLASQFGFQVNSGGSEIGSVQLIPDLIRLRSLHKAVLDRKFDFEDQPKNTSLIEYYFGHMDDFNSNKEMYYRKGSSKLASSLFLRKNKNNDIMKLTTSGGEAKFAAQLARVVVEELVNIQNKINLSRVKEQGQYLIERIDSLYSELAASEEKLKDFREKNRNISRSPKLLLDENRLARDLTTLELIYGNLKSEYEINRVEEIGDKQLIQVLDEPLVPLFRTSPKRKLMVIKAFFLTLVFSSFSAFLFDRYKVYKESV